MSDSTWTCHSLLWSELVCAVLKNQNRLSSFQLLSGELFLLFFRRWWTTFWTTKSISLCLEEAMTTQLQQQYRQIFQLIVSSLTNNFLKVWLSSNMRVTMRKQWLSLPLLIDKYNICICDIIKPFCLNLKQNNSFETTSKAKYLYNSYVVNNHQVIKSNKTLSKQESNSAFKKSQTTWKGLHLHTRYHHSPPPSVNVSSIYYALPYNLLFV